MTLQPQVPVHVFIYEHIGECIYEHIGLYMVYIYMRQGKHSTSVLIETLLTKSLPSTLQQRGSTQALCMSAEETNISAKEPFIPT